MKDINGIELRVGQKVRIVMPSEPLFDNKSGIITSVNVYGFIGAKLNQVRVKPDATNKTGDVRPEELFVIEE